MHKTFEQNLNRLQKLYKTFSKKLFVNHLLKSFAVLNHFSGSSNQFFL
jgi:hypothetical protein